MSLKLVVCALLLCNMHSLFAQDKEILVESRPLRSLDIQSVQAEAANGNIAVTGVSDGEARVEVYAWSEKARDKVKERFADVYDLSINTGNHKLSITCKLKERDRAARLSVSFRLYVPVGSSTELETSGGNLHLMKLTGGKHRAHTSGGNIAFDAVKGNVSGKTSGGNISVSNCGESIDVFTSGGNILARESNGKLKLSTSGGNISMEDLSGETKAETSGGNVTANNISGVLHTSSSGGNFRLVSLACAIEASTSGGHLLVEMRKLDQYVTLRNHGSGTTTLQIPGNAGVDLSVTGRSVKLDHASGFSGDMNEREVKGKLGSGGIPVTIEGSDSRVVVTLK